VQVASVRHDGDPAVVPDPGILNAPIDQINLTLNVRTNNNYKLMGTSFSVQNVRSLNISTKNDFTTQKILAICNLNTDFIFLCDLRLNSTKQVSALNDLNKRLFFKGYELIHNSTNSLRGVGILVKKKYSEQNYKLLNVINCDECNFICAHVEINDQKILLCAIYGPNRDTDISFYTKLKNTLRQFTCPIILGGDWNATLDTSNAPVNLDTLNMQNIPSLRRSMKIMELCQEFDLIEPFRTKFPSKREYTFVPTSVNETNRSRLDFFLMSTVLFNPNTSSTIPHSLTSTLFDHKPVFLHLKRKKIIRRDIIKDTILSSPDLDAHVKCAVFECYLHHHVLDPGGGANELNNLIENIGRIMNLLEEIKNLELVMAATQFTERQDLVIRGKRAEINLIFEDMPNLEYFENLQINHEPEIFFQTLVSCIKNNVLSHQATVFKLRSEKKKSLSHNYP